MFDEAKQVVSAMSIMLHKLLTAIGLRKENLPNKRPPRPEVTLSEAELEAVYQQLERMHILMVEAGEDNFSTGVRMATDKLRAAITAKNEILTRVYGREPLDAGPILDAYVGYGERL